MNSADEIYAAVIADPDNLDLRRRYADAIENTDPDRAEMIRSYLVRRTNTRQADAAIRRAWPHMADPVAHLLTEWDVRNGLVESVTMTARTFIDHGTHIRSQLPIRHVVLTDAAELVSDIADQPALDGLPALDLSDNPIGDGGVATLVRSPHLRKLRWLGLAGCGIGPAGAEALAAAHHNLPALRYVDMEDNPVRVVAEGDGQGIDGRPVFVDIPPFGQELINRYGYQPWLSIEWGWKRGIALWYQV